jgi:protoheme IX farnesyltransferase
VSGLRKYYRLTKPGIVYGNDLSAIAGFLLGASLLREFDLISFIAMLTGISLVIASACVINNIIDRDVDRKMARTKNRALVTGSIGVRTATMYGTALGVIGFGILAVFTNWLTVAVGAVGWLFYIVMYGIGKRRGPIGTIIGSVSGAAPIVGGYVAATGRFDTPAILLFLSMVFWQMPHFYAIAMYRFDDYKKAGIPVLPVVRGMRNTKFQNIVYILAFTAASELLTILGYTGYLYLAVMIAVCVWWLKLALEGLQAKEEAAWARQFFLFSLIILVVFSAALSVGALLP